MATFAVVGTLWNYNITRLDAALFWPLLFLMPILFGIATAIYRRAFKNH